jgi:polygalacturonase
MKLNQYFQLATGILALGTGLTMAGSELPEAEQYGWTPPLTMKIYAPPIPIFEVHAYGAKGNGVVNDTKAIQKAIDNCAGTGGSVVLRNGRFVAANLHLEGKMTFYIAGNATLLGSTNPADYPVVVPYTEADSIGIKWNQRSLLYADKADGLVLDGGGVIDGRGADLNMTGPECNRPSLLRIYRSHNVTVRNLSLRHPRMWTEVYEQCVGLTIENLDVFSPPICRNLDGLDVCDCHDVVIRHCHINSEDDSICLKSHSMFGLKNVLVQGNTIVNQRANGIKIGTATIGPIENIRILNNTVEKAYLGGLCIESVDGSVIHDVLVSNLTLRATCQPIFITLADRNDWRLPLIDHKAGPGEIRDVVIEDVRILGTHNRTKSSMTLTGLPGAPLRNIALRHIAAEMPGGVDKMPPSPKEMTDGYPQSNRLGIVPGYAFYVRHAKNIVFDHVTTGYLKPDVRSWLVVEDATVTTNNCSDERLLRHGVLGMSTPAN